jgi:hypothetical protein
MSYIPLTLELAEAVARNLSPRDRAEVLALRPESGDDDLDLEVWAGDVMRTPEHLRTAWAVMLGDEPVAMGGIVRHPGLPHLATSWFVGTARKLEAGVAVMRGAIDGHAIWQDRGVRKFQCMCLDSPELSSRWLVRLGYAIEGIYPQFGRNGETFKVWGRNHGSR